ncbi:glycosyltransferase, partial [Streptococcus danieliae]|nr:glycosyltransferase [Streptococcus danieliae]
NQSVKVDRVIILDDCSTDDTFKILQNYIEEHSLKLWEVLQNESNQGHYQTFINLTRLVDEGMAFFSDQDDIWDLNKVEVMLSQFENE